MGWTERGSHKIRNIYCSLLICISCLSCFLKCGFESSYSCPVLFVYFLTRRVIFTNNLRFWCGSNFVPSLTTFVIVVIKWSIFALITFLATVQQIPILPQFWILVYFCTLLFPERHAYYRTLFSFNIWHIAWLVSVFL